VGNLIKRSWYSFLVGVSFAFLLKNNLHHRTEGKTRSISEAMMCSHLNAVLFWCEVGGERSSYGIRWDTGERINKHILAGDAGACSQIVTRRRGTTACDIIIFMLRTVLNSYLALRTKRLGILRRRLAQTRALPIIQLQTHSDFPSSSPVIEMIGQTSFPIRPKLSTAERPDVLLPGHWC
jgi:hypothetical protein